MKKQKTTRAFDYYIDEPGQVLDSTVRHYICNLQALRNLRNIANTNIFRPACNRLT